MERARLTHKLAQMKEEEGNITEAANIIQELQVETYGSMEKREKVSILMLPPMKDVVYICIERRVYLICKNFLQLQNNNNNNNH